MAHIRVLYMCINILSLIVPLVTIPIGFVQINSALYLNHNLNFKRTSDMNLFI